MSDALGEKGSDESGPVWGQQIRPYRVRALHCDWRAGAFVNLASRYLFDFVMLFEAAVVPAYMIGMVFALFLSICSCSPAAAGSRRAE
jgi:hypothetical protein